MEITDMQEITIRSYLFDKRLSLQELTLLRLGKVVADYEDLSYTEAAIILDAVKGS
jgi:hypothetical protein